MGKCKFYKRCKHYTDDNDVCNIHKGMYYGDDRPAGCYRLLESKQVKSKLFLSLIMSIFLLSFISAAYCYQETANVSTACGGLATGSFVQQYGPNTWNSGNNLFDGNWSTYAIANMGGANYSLNSVYANVTYKKPQFALNSSIWTIKYDINETANAIINFSIPSSCWNYNSLEINFIIEGVNGAIGSFNKISLYCFNGTNNLITTSIPASYDIYEEAIIWDIPNIINSYPANNSQIKTTSISFGCNSAKVFGDITQMVLNVTGTSAWTQSISGLTAFYDKAVDRASGANNGTLVNEVVLNSTFAKNGLGGASFDGVNDYVNISYSTSLNLSRSNKFSFSLWYNSSSASSYMLSQYSFAGNKRTFVVGLSASSYPQFLIYHDGSATNVTSATFGTNYLGIYTHLACSYNGTSFICYQNGQFVTRINDTIGSGLYDSSLPFKIGSSGDNSNYFNGSIDDVRIFNRTLSQAEITSLYTTNSIADTTGLVAYYDMENDTRYTNSFNVTFTNSTLTDGTYNWNCIGYGTNGINASSDIWSFIKDLNNPFATLISPTNNTYSNSTTNNLTANISDNVGIANYTINIYNSTGLVNQTTILTPTNPFSLLIGFIVDLIDGVYTWFLSVTDIGGNTYTSEVRTLTVDTVNPMITINSPIATNYSTTNILINITIVDVNLNTIWYTIGTPNHTYTTPTYFNFSEGSNTLYIFSNDSAGNINSTSVTFNIDLTSPVITITSPITNLGYISMPYNMSINYSVIDPLLQSCWYNLDNGANITLPSCSNSSRVLSTINQANTLNIFANDTVGNINNASRAFTYDLAEYNRSYSNPVIEFSTDTFTINTSINPIWTSRVATLVRSGISYAATETSSGFFSTTLSIPSGSGSNSLYWMLNLSNATANTLITTTTTTQNVTPIGFLLCNSTSNVSFLHFETRSIDTKALVNATFKSTLNIGIGTSRKTVTFNDINENVSSWDFCLSPADSTYKGEVKVQYDANLYSQNYYYLVNTTLTNVTSNVTLYLLNESKTTLTTFTFLDRATFGYPELYGRIQMYDVGTDTYYTVSMLKSNHEGNDISYLYWYDTLYKLVILENNTVLQSTQPFKISYTPQTFRIAPEEIPNYEKFEDVQYSLTYNNLTGNVILTFTTGDARVTSGCLRVLKQTASNETQICNTCETSSSATVYCNLLPYGNGTYIATFYATGSLSNIDTQEITIGTLHQLYTLIGSDDATFYAFITAGIVWVFFMVNPIMGVIGAIIGLAVTMALGFTYFNMATFITLVIGGGIVIWIIKR